MRWLAVLALTLSASACEDTENDCAGLSIVPNPSVLNFGDLYARGTDERGDPDDPTRTPSHRVVILKNGCGGTLEIESVCIASNHHNGVGEPAFLLEAPLETALAPGAVTAARITFDHTVVNDDLDLDGTRDPDIAALVVQSSAANAPTLVVPLCARIIADDESPEPYDCPAPFTVPEGQLLANACDL